MSRRNVSPMRTRTVSDVHGPGGMLDERDLIVKKLKEQLIVARSREKEVVILQNYLGELREKIRIIGEDVRRKQTEVKSKAEMSQKTINELKRQVELYKVELKNKSVELGEKEGQLLEMKRHLTKRNTQLEKLKKQTIFLKQENDAYLKYEEMESELNRIEATNRNYETRISEINSKIGEVKAYIAELNNESRILKDKLKQHEQENNNINEDLNTKQENIEDLEKVFADQHDNIKNHIDTYIELEHKNQKILTETRHKVNLTKAEGEKSSELNAAIQKIDKALQAVNKQNQSTQEQIRNYSETNNKFEKYNEQLTKDLAKCQAHLQNLIKYNSQIQDELEKCLREDEQVVSVIRRKRAVDMIPMRESRKGTDRTYV